MLVVTPTITLDEHELVERFVTASGPGGQNVNKVSTAVRLRFDASRSPALPDAVKSRLPAIAGGRMTRDGIVNILAQRFASQERNREDARERLAALIREAADPPRPRRKTRVSKSQKRKRLDDKSHRATTKQLRTSPLYPR